MAEAIVPLQRQMQTHCPCGDDHRLIIKTHVAIEGDCWRWTGRTNGEGYGGMLHNRRQWRAHRLSYIAFRGHIPQGLVMDHLCRNRWCVNPDHLEPVTDRVNILRSNGLAARNARKDQCVRGHSDWGSSNGARYCLTCARAAQARSVRSGLISDDPSDPRHGTRNGYGNLGCRCDRCTRANADAKRAYMRRRRATAKEATR